MVFSRAVSVREVGEHFAVLVEPNPNVVKLWAATGVNGFDLIVLTRSIDDDREREIYHLGPVLRQRYPNAIANILILNPDHWNLDSERELTATVIPSGAIEFPLENR